MYVNPYKYYTNSINPLKNFLKTLGYDASEYYKKPEDLIFLLKHTPIITNFGQENGDFGKLDKFIKQNISNKGIKTNFKRYMVIVEK